MHMADALLSPAVGGAMWAASAGTIAYCSGKLGKELDDRKVPLMGVLGAFLFAAQMINFAIPGTGSSGHLSGGLLLTILLGPSAAFLTISSVLVVQALFFADGGLLALGCNIFNMGFVPAFIVFPFIYRKLIGRQPSHSRLTIATMISAIIGLQLGPFAVVLETLSSGMSSLPFSTFALLIQPIHLAIGLVEGVITVAVVSFVRKARPEILQGADDPHCKAKRPMANVLFAFLACAVITAGVISSFASANPDGLEWAIAKVTGKVELQPVEQGVHGTLAGIQEKSAWLPEYNFRRPAQAVAAVKPGITAQDDKVNVGTSVAGLIGTFLTLLLAFGVGLLLKKRNQRPD
jgi:cobalt/nickel transport system permease protein